MNVALLHYSAPPVVGGVEAVIGHQARLLAQAGHRVTLVAGRGAAVAGAKFAGLPVLDSRNERVLALKADLDAGRVPAAFEALADEIAAALRDILAGTDVLLAHNVASLHKNLALTAALFRLNGQPGFPRLILWQHDLAWTAAQYRSELHAGYPWQLLRQVWPGARLVVISEARRQELARLLKVPAEGIRVVSNGVDATGLLKLGEQTRALARAFNLDQAAPLVLLPVRLTRRKNIELALHTLAALRAWPADDMGLFANAMLVVTGPEGPHNPANAVYRRGLLALRDDLGLAGAAHFAVEYSDVPLPDDVVADLYRLADALILPSREEGFGLPLLEAALSRLPVFCTDLASLAELGRGGVTYFSPDADPRDVAGAMVQRLRADPVYRLALRVRQGYTWERVYAEHIEPLLHER